MVDETGAEFLFGHLSTVEGRAAEVRGEAVGFYALSLLEPLDPRPGEPIRLRFCCGIDLGLERVTVYWTADGRPPSWSAAAAPSAGAAPAGVTRMTAAQRVAVRWNTLAWSYVEEWEAALPPQPDGALVQYVALGEDAEGRCRPCPTSAPQSLPAAPRADCQGERLAFRERHGSPEVFAVVVDRLAPPPWLREAVIYQVFVDRFAPDPGQSFSDASDLTRRLGGTLRGLIGQLDHLCGLGITCLWLTPVFASPDYHGYATSDFFRIEPALGGDAAWVELRTAAGRRGLRLVLDFVANHVSDTHQAFRQAQRSADGPTRGWFRFRRWPHDYHGFFDMPSQPELDAEHPAVRDELIGAAGHWLAQGCDGFRLDYARGLSHGFWSRFRRATRRQAPESVCLGEVNASPAVLRSYTGRLDGCLDFYLCELLRAAFGRGDLPLSIFDRQVRRHLVFVGEGLVLPSFLDNHDMNRFLWIARGDRRRLRLAALCQFLLPGPPILYYGTEVGLGQRAGLGPLEEARLPLPPADRWDRDLPAFFRALIRLRRRMEPWRLQPVPERVEDERELLVWRLGKLRLVLSRAQGNRLPLEPGAAVLLTTGADVAWAPASGLLTLPPWSGAALRPADPGP